MNREVSSESYYSSDDKVKMTPAERFVVVAGVSLLLFNLILFSLCISLVLDSRAARNDTAHLIVLTDRLLESHQATPWPEKVHAITDAPETTITPSPEGIETTRAQEMKVVEGCPFLPRSNSPTSLPPQKVETQKVTEVASSTEPEYEVTSDEPSRKEGRIRSMEERMNSLEKLLQDLLKRSSDMATTEQPTHLKRRRNGGLRGAGGIEDDKK